MNSDTGRTGEMMELRRLGWTLAAIGAKYGITRQRVHQILEKAKKAARQKRRAARMAAAGGPASSGAPAASDSSSNP